MTKQFDLYGSQSLPVIEVARRLEAALDVVVESHESSYLGGDYCRAEGGDVGELIVQSNFEDEDGYLAEPDFPAYVTLVYVTDASDVVTAQLRGLSDLKLLRTEVV